VFETAVDSPWLVPFDGRFEVAEARTKPPKGAPPKKERQRRLVELVERLDELQRRLFADNRWGLLTVFQAMDAAGKDGTIRAVLSGVDPSGCQVSSFKAPSAEELDHDFLWRVNRHLPERGRIGVFNRSHYEEVLVVRVHPEFLDAQRLPRRPDTLEELFAERLESIVDYERHLARNGMCVVKFWLNVSREEQRQRFLERLNEPEKHWKFNSGDVKERGHWDEYMHAYQHALRATSKPWAPWYAIPADSKSFARLEVARILAATLEHLDPHYPVSLDAERARFAEMKALLEAEGS
jgi:PPK2 family polyphosphate:nucleotide phosphotransferase